MALKGMDPEEIAELDGLHFHTLCEQNADALAELFKMTVVWKDKIADEDLGVVPPSATDIDTEYSALYNAIFGGNNDINMKNLLLAFIAFYFRNR